MLCNKRQCSLCLVFASFAGVLQLAPATGWAKASDPAKARAASTAPSLQASLSQYERDVLRSVLEARQLTIEDNPEGKSIEAIDIEAREVFEPTDPVPDWVNWFHTTSRESVIEREVLLRPGQHFDRRMLEETARNLRKLSQLSLVLVVPVKSTSPNQLRLLVITKDVWSLRLNETFRVRNGTIEYLALQPSEINVAGTHLSLAGQYVYDLSTNTFGGSIAHQRLFGSRIRASLSMNAIQYRKSGEFEGSFGTLTFGQPLYSTRTAWAWGTSLSWLNANHRLLRPNASGSYVPRLYQVRDAPELGALPYQFHTRSLSWQTSVTRSYGTKHKSNVSFGLEALQRNFDANLSIREGYAPELVRRFEQNALERKNVRIGPFAMLETYNNSYVTMYDVETLGLQEDFQLGPRSFIKVYTGTREALGTRDLVGITAAVQHTSSFGGSLVRFWATHSTELSPRSADNDGLIQGGLRLVSPPLGLGRLFFDGGGLYHYQNSRNLRFALGGDGRLRGYPSDQFLGHHLVLSNLEFRTRSVKLMDVLLGLVGFYDVGDAFDAANQLHPKHSVGFGGRATLPQFQRVVGRLDVAFPLTRPIASAGEGWSGVTWFLAVEGQAFPFPVAQSSTTRSPLLTPPD